MSLATPCLDEWLLADASFSPTKAIETCGTPLSQTSTAPCTPFATYALEPLDLELGEGVNLMSLLQEEEQNEMGLFTQSFLVDNSKLRAPTMGLSYRLTKDFCDVDCSLKGPQWGSVVEGIDQGDGWIRTSGHFLPTTIDDKCVLSVAPFSRFGTGWKSYSVDLEAGGNLGFNYSSPAVTSDGCVVNLDEAKPVLFAYDRHLSYGAVWKNEMIEAARAARAMRLAHAALEGESQVMNDKACSIDELGNVRGADAMPPPQNPAQTSLASRLKRFHRRRRARANRRFHPSEGCTLLVDEVGKVLLYLSFPNHANDLRRRQQKTNPIIVECCEDVVSVDRNGCVHENHVVIDVDADLDMFRDIV